MARHELRAVHGTPDGFTAWTLQQMRRLALGDVERLRPLAQRLTGGQPSARGASQLLGFVRSRVRYVEDPELQDGTPVELVRTPSECLQEAAGDCDDQVCLLGCLALAAGMRASAVAVATTDGAFVHVYAELGLPDGTIWPADPIVPGAPLGWWPAHRRSMRVRF